MEHQKCGAEEENLVIYFGVQQHHNEAEHRSQEDIVQTPKWRNQLCSFKKRSKEANFQHIKEGIALFKSCIAPSVTRNIVELLKRTQLKGKKQIRNKAGNQYQRQESKIAHHDLLLQLIFVPVFQKRITNDEGYKRKENIQRKRIVGEDGIRKPLEIIFKRIQRSLGQTFPANEATDLKHQQKVQNTHGYGAPTL
jgi:hypothetical protein